MRCLFCGKDYVQGCWTGGEAAHCGNLDANAIRQTKELAAALAKVESERERSASDVEKHERRELARLKAKYEPID